MLRLIKSKNIANINRLNYQFKNYSQLVRLGKHVEQALKNNEPIVSLESTIISHGMPYPQNVETAVQVEDIVRAQGGTPATVGLINGEIVVGLTREEIELLGKEGSKVKKASRRDLSSILSQKILGATTVSTTMIASHLANIPIFVTGGIGGVHRGAEQSFDISADLTELGRTPVGVVCSGVKSILDIEKTLEYLETQGVPVVTVSNKDYFPGFFVSDSGFKSPINLEKPLDCAKLIDTQFKYQLNNGVVFAVPIPDAHAADGHLIQKAIQQALEECERGGIKGKLVTPYLLEKINNLTQGKSLQSNINLVKNNAKVGTDISVELSHLRNARFHPQSNASSAQVIGSSDRNRPMVVGGICLDLISKSHTSDKSKLLETSTPGKIDLTPGGVAFNITQVLHQLGTNPSFHSIVGNDLFGNYLLSQLKSKNIDFNNIHQMNPDKSEGSTVTAVYSGLYSHSGNMVGAVADMDLFDKINTDAIVKYIQQNQPKLICLDGNLSKSTLSKIIQSGRQANSFIVFEPTSVPKSVKIPEYPSVHLITPNSMELVEMYGFYVAKDKSFKVTESQLKDVTFIEDLAMQLLEHFPYILVKMGSQGVMLVTSKHSVYMKPDTVVKNPVNVSGAGDSLVGTVIGELAKLENPFEADEKWWKSSLEKGQHNARLTLDSKLTVSELIQ